MLYANGIKRQPTGSHEYSVERIVPTCFRLAEIKHARAVCQLVQFLFFFFSLVADNSRRLLLFCWLVVCLFVCVGWWSSSFLSLLVFIDGGGGVSVVVVVVAAALLCFVFVFVNYSLVQSAL